MKFFHSLFFKHLFGFLVISLIPLNIAGYITYKNTSNNMTDNLNFHASYILEQKGEALNQLHQNLERLSNGIITNRYFSEFTENTDYRRHQQLYIELDKLLVSIDNMFPTFEGITIINEENFMYYYGYSLALNASSQDIVNSDWYDALDGISYPKISPLHNRDYSQATDEEPVYSFIYEGWDNKLRNRSIIIIDFTEEFLSNILKSASGSETVAGSVVYDSNQIVYSSNDKPNLSYDSLVNNPSGTIITDEKSGQQYILYKQKIPKLGWTLVEYFHTESLYQPVTEIQELFNIAILLSILFCLGASIFVTRQISSPIYKLQRKMKEVEQGNFEEEFITRSKDVIGDLANGFNHMLGRIKVLIKSVAHEEKLKREAEITALQLQINPHFIYNTLESINSLTRKKREHEISHLIVLLGRLLRMSISSFDEKILISKELEYIRYYLEIQQKRMRHPLDFAIHIEPGLENYKIIKWILQPIVENAIIHGIDPLRKAGNINISIKKDKQYLVFSIRDNGVGIEEEQLREIRSKLATDFNELTKYKERIGLFNVQSRIKLHYGNAYGIYVNSEKGKGTEFLIIIPETE